MRNKKIVALAFAAFPCVSYAALTGNIATSGQTGTACGLGNIGNLPTLATGYSAGGKNYIFLTSTYLVVGVNSGGGVTSIAYGNVTITFNTTDRKYIVTFPSGSSVAASYTGNYSGTAGQDSIVSQHYAAILDCGLTVTGETGYVGN